MNLSILGSCVCLTLSVISGSSSMYRARQTCLVNSGQVGRRGVEGKLLVHWVDDYHTLQG